MYNSKKIKLSFLDLKINANTIFRELKYNKESVPEEFAEAINRELKFAEKNFEAKTQYFITTDFELGTKLRIQNQSFLIGDELLSILDKSELIALFISTAGKKITLRNHELNKKGKVIEAYANDVIGNIIVEKTADYLLKHVKKEFPNQKTTNRYSPGNCGWEQMNQHGFFSLYPKIEIGVSLSKSGMMNPLKSINGIIGIGQDVNYKANTCMDCPSQNCLYRKSL